MRGIHRAIKCITGVIGGACTCPLTALRTQQLYDPTQNEGSTNGRTHRRDANCQTDRTSSAKYCAGCIRGHEHQGCAQQYRGKAALSPHHRWHDTDCFSRTYWVNGLGKVNGGTVFALPDQYVVFRLTIRPNKGTFKPWQ